MKNGIILMIMVLLSACTSTSRTTGRTSPRAVGGTETPQEMEEALESVVSAVSGKEVDYEDLKKLEEQLRQDEEAQTAVQAITEDYTQKGIKYCPETGKRYHPRLENCPIHHIPLKWVAEE